MGLQLNLVKSFVLLVPSLAATAIAMAPSQAATSALSQTELELTNFSQQPEDVIAISKIKALSISSSGSLNLGVNTEVLSDSGEKYMRSFSSHLAEGADGDYFGFSKSVTKVLGDFLVKKETFSFDFSTFLGLQTSVDHPQFEYADSKGKTSILLYDAHKNRLLDSFSIAGALFTKDQGDFLKIKASKNFAFSSIETDTDFQGKQELAIAKITGQFSRFFRKETHLRLLQVQRNQVSVEGESVKVPESSNTLALLLFSAAGVGLVIKNKRAQKRSLPLAISLPSDD